MARLLSRAGLEVVGLAADGDAGAELAGRTSPDVVVFDLAMPGGGFAGLARVKKMAPASRILVVTALDDPWLPGEADRAGADGLLVKTATPLEFVAAIRRCFEGAREFPISPALSPREEEVFALLAEGVPNREIAVRLGVSVKTVESHLERLKGKLGCGSAAELRALALRRQK